MPANVETLAYTSARGVPWHGLGTPVDGLMTATEAIDKAGLGWTVECEPIQTAAGEPIDFKRAVIRQSDRAILGVVGMGYQPVQNDAAFDFADAIVADTGSHYETAGSLDGGRTVFLSMELSGVDPITVAGDSDVNTFLLLSNAHDGSKALRVTVTPVRVVCQNTLNFAFAGSKGIFNIRHTGKVDSKLEAARDALGIAVDYMRRFEKVASALQELKVTDTRAVAVMRDVFGMSEDVEDSTDSVRFTGHHATVAFEAYKSTPDLTDWLGTGWGVVNAVAQYVDHDRTYGKGTDRQALDVKATQVLWGGGAGILNRTVALLDPKLAKLMDKQVVRGAASMATRVAAPR
jgi:phage/plasmid-like protein (TIGR03299 family)